MRVQVEIVPIEGKCVTLYDDRGVKAAHGCVYPLFNLDHDDPHAVLEGLWVSKEHLNQGYADSLLRRLEEIAQKEWSYKISLTSRYSRRQVHKWYMRHGYTTTGKAFRKELPPHEGGA